jgi:hypothetical protein
LKLASALSKPKAPIIAGGTLMGSIVFEGQPPFELMSVCSPRATAEDGSVTLTLPVFMPEAPARRIEIHVVLTLEHATDLAARLQPALATATEKNQ